MGAAMGALVLVVVGEVVFDVVGFGECATNYVAPRKHFFYWKAITHHFNLYDA